MQYMAITPQGKEVDVINVSHFVDKQLYLYDNDYVIRIIIVKQLVI